MISGVALWSFAVSITLLHSPVLGYLEAMYSLCASTVWVHVCLGLPTSLIQLLGLLDMRVQISLAWF